MKPFSIKCCKTKTKVVLTTERNIGKYHKKFKKTKKENNNKHTHIV